MCLHRFGFNVKGRDVIDQLNIDGNTNLSLMGSIGANIRLPLKPIMLIGLE